MIRCSVFDMEDLERESKPRSETRSGSTGVKVVVLTTHGIFYIIPYDISILIVKVRERESLVLPSSISAKGSHL